MTRPVATLSIDVDPVDLHLIGYGYPGLPPDPLVYLAALPRLAQAFARHGLQATFFCVGRDAEAHAGELHALARAGHEIASHTWSHPIGFAGLAPARQRAELEDSRRALSEASGVGVVGFRAPNFDMHARVVPRLAAAGYRYDASAYPSLLLLPARAVLALKSADPLRVLAMRPWPFTWRRRPYDWRAGGAAIREFPVAMTPTLRLPVYHTMRWLASERSFESAIEVSPAAASRSRTSCTRWTRSGSARTGWTRDWAVIRAWSVHSSTSSRCSIGRSPRSRPVSR